MHIGVVTPRYPPNINGGGEISVKLLVDNLGNHPDISQVSVFSFDKGYDEVVDGIEVKRFSLPTRIMEISNPIAISKLSGELDDIDLLHAYNMELHPAVGYISEAYDIPSVATLNSYTFISGEEFIASSDSMIKYIYKSLFLPTTGKLLTHSLDYVDRFIALSDSVKRIYANNLIYGERINTIPNMIDPTFEEQLPESHPEKVNIPPKILYVGALKEEKGVEYLIRAMEHLPNIYSLSIIGEGPQGTYLKELSQEISLNEQVDFHGHVPYEKIGQQYTEADVFVHPGIWPEPFGRTIQEAMQAGLPVVCTDVGAPPTIVSNDKVTADVADPHSLAESIIYAYKNREGLGRLNYDKIKSQYSPEEVVFEIVGLYSELINRNNPSRYGI